MQNGMAGEPDNVDVGPWVAPEELLYRGGVQSCQLLFDLGDRTDAAENRSQPFAKPCLVRNRQRGPGNHTLFAIGLDHRKVDAVERSTAHQPECSPDMLGVFWPRSRTHVS